MGTVRRLLRWFDLREDQADVDAIDAAIHSGSRVRGTNLWVLFFAMLIASVGLNVNSTAVIIGAMLISPLMGPIVGLGYGLAVADWALIRTAARGLLLFVALSLASATLYFTLSPLDEAGSELLARTQPTLWDVLIAAFGGAAGMVALTRRSFSNIVPGVAIATALMPPLCTVGYGLAHARWDMASGAFYLFLINGVFIAFATLVVTRLLRLPWKQEIDDAARRRHRLLMGLGLLVVLVPSVWQGYRLVQDEVFRGAARDAIRALELRAGTPLLDQQVQARERLIRLTVVGPHAADRLRELAPAVLQTPALDGARLEIRRAGDEGVDVNPLRRELQQEMGQALALQIRELEQRLARSEAALSAANTPPDQSAQLLRELQALQPGVSGLELAQSASGRPLLLIDLARPLKPADRERLTRWLRQRLDHPDAELVERPLRPNPKA